MKSDFKEGRQGLTSKNGKLFEFTKRHVLVLSPWPDPRAWFKRRSHGWKATRKWADEVFTNRVLTSPLLVDEPLQQQLLLDGLPLVPADANEMMLRAEARNCKAAQAYRDGIPAEILEELNRYTVRKWYLFNTMARCPGALDLSRSNPALYFALACNWVFHKPAVRQPIRAARSLMYKKQKVILEWLGFPATETTRRILAKIAPEALTVERLLYLRLALANEGVVKVLSHLERINGAVLSLVTHNKLKPYTTPRFLEDVSRDTSRHGQSATVLDLMRDTLKMAEEIQWKDCPRVFCSLQRLQDVHDQLIRRLNRMNVDERCKRVASYVTRFPSPPFIGTAHIRPLETPRALIEEGVAMRHCVGSYTNAMNEGSVYIYQVLDPIRATLEIIESEGSWYPGQLYQMGNKSVDKPLAQQLFNTLLQSGRTPMTVRDGDYWPSPAVLAGQEPAPVARCELPEGEKLPLSWTLHNPKQLPLLPPDDLALYRHCLEIFKVRQVG
jgi:hypothetical protein